MSDELEMAEEWSKSSGLESRENGGNHELKKYAGLKLCKGNCGPG